MKFITEQELRSQYNKSPFTDYLLMPETKVTPGAQQFLNDRKITVSMNQNRLTSEHLAEPMGRIKNQKLLTKYQWVLSLALITCQQMIHQDAVMAQEVFALEQQLRQMLNDPESSVQTWPGCTGINNEMMAADCGDCFEVTTYHLQLEKGNQIVLLHHLRCSLRELLQTSMEIDEDQSSAVSLGLQQRISPLVNRLSQLICISMGGTSCQR